METEEMESDDGLSTEPKKRRKKKEPRKSKKSSSEITCYDFKIERKYLVEAARLLKSKREQPRFRTKLDSEPAKVKMNVENFCSHDPLISPSQNKSEVPFQTPVHKLLWASREAALAHDWTSLARVIPHITNYSPSLNTVAWKSALLVLLNMHNQHNMEEFLKLCLSLHRSSGQAQFLEDVLTLDVYESHADKLAKSKVKRTTRRSNNL